MENQNSNSEKGKSLNNFKGDAINGDQILGGGDMSMPTYEDEANGINNSGFPVKGKEDGFSEPNSTNADGSATGGDLVINSL